MKFLNESGSPAELFRGELPAGIMCAALLARVRLRLDPAGRLMPASDGYAVGDIRRDVVEDDYGPLEPDLPYPRSGTDVIVYADAAAPQPVTSHTVSVRVGSYGLELLVVGDRRWVRGAGGLVPSAPRPFTRMPLTWGNAFGGKASTPYGELQEPANPLGKGFYVDEAAALGGPLPNIEDPAHPVRRWDDRPEPVGVAPYPSNWFLRHRACVELRPETGTLELYPERGMFDRAHPRLCGKFVGSGDVIEVTGTAFAPRLVLQVPACPLEMVLQLGDREHVRTLDLEEIVLDLRTGHVDFGYRKLCKYRFVPHARRSITLRARAGGPA